MHIVKNLNDIEIDANQKRFVDLIKARVDNYNTSEKIVNHRYLKQYLTPANNLVLYNNMTPYARMQRLAGNDIL